MIETTTNMSALWWAVIGAGFYHGLNPGMGWPLAVSGALMKDKVSSLLSALLLLFVGHFFAMAMILIPFSFSDVLVTQQRNIRIIAGLIVITTGLILLIYNKHPRFLSRISPYKIGLWSFMAAMAHGAGLMVVPLLLGLSMGCIDDLPAGQSTPALSDQASLALGVASAHSIAMFVAASIMAVLVYFWLGVGFLSKSWFNLDRVWALSLVLFGAFGLYSAW